MTPHGSPAVEVDHGQVVPGVHGGDVAHLAKPRRAHQAGDHGLLLGQQVPEGVQGLLPGQVQGDGPDGAGGEGGQGLQPVLPPADGPDLLDLGVPAELADVPLPCPLEAPVIRAMDCDM